MLESCLGRSLTIQHLEPDSVGHLGIYRVKQCSLTVIWLLLLEFPLCLDL